ncbi:hypothetical protein DFH07DRAFT_951765 [Mycena maculata]|uniref:Uncharacterized protein n=1 Tax=Mycena maculata TaxID=230809 RepID=A0AAD7K280_9AGAR|nr:hypothetical protein DFH07DRAFT_951765 [Mycena maculata]
MSRPRSTRSSNNSVYSVNENHARGLRGITEYEAAAAYGEPALSDSSSDEQIARAISESKKTARSPPVSRAFSYASSSASTLLGSGSGSSSPRSEYARSHTSSPAYPGVSPTPTPRYAADEVIARNLARSWRVAGASPRRTRAITIEILHSVILVVLFRPADVVSVPQPPVIAPPPPYATPFLQWYLISPYPVCPLYGLGFVPAVCYLGVIDALQRISSLSPLRLIYPFRLFHPLRVVRVHGPLDRLDILTHLERYPLIATRASPLRCSLPPCVAPALAGAFRVFGVK